MLLQINDCQAVTGISIDQSAHVAYTKNNINALFVNFPMVLTLLGIAEPEVEQEALKAKSGPGWDADPKVVNV